MIRRALIFSAVLPFIAGTSRVYAQSLDNNQGAIEISEPSSAETDRSANGASRKFQPKVGRRAAEKYMAPRQPTSGNSGGSGGSYASESGGSSNEAHYLALHIGSYISDTAYKWGAKDTAENVGKLNMGLTYRLGEWINSADLAIRVDFSTFGLQEGRASKLSFVPIVLFPDAKSKFPLYFGGGVGAGVFVTQISQESTLTLDYQLVAGARFFNIMQNTGFFIEAGIKNHLFLLSDGQFNGTFAAIGTVFSF